VLGERGDRAVGLWVDIAEGVEVFGCGDVVGELAVWVVVCCRRRIWCVWRFSVSKVVW